MGDQGGMFADPLGVRSGSQRSQASNRRGPENAPRDPPRQQQYDRYGRGPGDSEDAVTREEDEEEQWGPIGSFLWSFVAGGRQCCSMRDRSKPQDQEAARRAAETGRPPRSQFPEPRPAAGRDGRDDMVPAPSYQLLTNRTDPDSRPATRAPTGRAFEDDGRRPSRLPAEEPPMGFNAYSASREVPPPVPPSREVLGPPPGARPPPKEDADEDRSPPKRPEPAKSPPQKTREPEVVAQPPPPAARAPEAAIESSTASAGPSKRWEWPPWCLNFKNPEIEVYVVDEDDGGKGRWVEAEPQSRVVDKAGRDAYLCVEYEWDNEFYVQDFGPQHVRKRGNKQTVFDMFDKGGGVSAFLND